VLENVIGSSVRRPEVSIVKTAGRTKWKLVRPKPKEASRALSLRALAWRKIVDEWNAYGNYISNQLRALMGRSHTMILIQHIRWAIVMAKEASSPGHPWSCKGLRKALEVVAVPDDVFLNLDLGVDVR
jgi:hypothetical protein